MLENQNEIKRIVSTIIKLFQEQGDNEITRLLKASSYSTEMVHYDNWNGGTDYYSLHIDIDATVFAFYEEKIKDFENRIEDKFEVFLRGIENEVLSNVIIRPVARQYLDWASISDGTTKSGLIEHVQRIKSLLISVSTGGPKIQSVNNNYKKLYSLIDNIFEKLGITNPNGYKDLWEWYGRWSAGDLPTYQSRRQFINDLYLEVLELIEKSNDDTQIDQPYEITGWERVDRGVSEIRKRMNEAKTEEQFQTVGLLSREVIISLAQEVYDSNIHISPDEIKPSSTDAKRLLDAFISHELRGSSNEAYRKYAKSALALANDLTHRRSANIQEASVCVIAVISLVNIIKVITQKTNIRF